MSRCGEALSGEIQTKVGNSNKKAEQLVEIFLIKTKKFWCKIHPRMAAEANKF